MQSPDLSLAGKLDNLLTKGFCSLLGGLANTFIWLLGLLVLVGQPIQIFEYGEGLSDVSWAEWGFMLLFVLLLRRHVHYCRHFSTGYWTGLSRLVVFQGRFACIGLSILGFMVGLESLLGASADLPSTVDPAMDVTGSGLVLLMLYLAAPTSSATSMRSNVSPPVEPTRDPAEKEVAV